MPIGCMKMDVGGGHTVPCKQSFTQNISTLKYYSVFYVKT